MLQFLTSKSSKSQKSSKSRSSRSTTRRKHVTSGLFRCTGGERSRSCTPERNARMSCRLPAKYTQLSLEDFRTSLSPTNDPTSPTKSSFASKFKKKSKAERKRLEKEQQKKKVQVRQHQEKMLSQLQKLANQQEQPPAVNLTSAGNQPHDNDAADRRPYSYEPAPTVGARVINSENYIIPHISHRYQSPQRPSNHSFDCSSCGSNAFVDRHEYFVGGREFFLGDVSTSVRNSFSPARGSRPSKEFFSHSNSPSIYRFKDNRQERSPVIYSRPITLGKREDQNPADKSYYDSPSTSPAIRCRVNPKALDVRDSGLLRNHPHSSEHQRLCQRLESLTIDQNESSKSRYFLSRHSPTSVYKYAVTRRKSSCRCCPSNFTPVHTSSSNNSSESRLANDSGVCSVSDEDKSCVLTPRGKSFVSLENSEKCYQYRRLQEVVKRSQSSPCYPSSTYQPKVRLSKIYNLESFVKSSWITDMVHVTKNNVDLIVAVDTASAFVIGSNGLVWCTIGGKEHGDHCLVQPISLALYTDESVVFNDRGQHNIKIFTLDDVLLRIIDDPHFTNIAGLSTNPDGDIFIASIDLKCILVIRFRRPDVIERIPKTRRTPNSGTVSDERTILDHPYCLAVNSSSGHVIVGDDERHSVVASDPNSGQVLWRFMPSGAKKVNFLPACVCTDWRGSVFVGDSCNCKVYLLDSSGKYSRTIITRCTGLDGSPTAMCTDSVGRLYVSDEQSTIKVFRYLDEESL